MSLSSFAAAALFIVGCASQPAVPPKVAAVPLTSADVSAQQSATAPPPSTPYPIAEADLANEPAANAREPLANHHSIDGQRAAGWVLIGVGTIGLLGAIGTSGLMLHDESVRTDNCNAAKICNADGANANSQINTLAGWNVASWIVGVAGVGVGAFLLLTDSKEEKQVAVGVAPNGAGSSLLLKGTF